MDRFGAAFGIAFAIEGIFFFIEAIFLAIYIYGWKRLGGWAHFWSGVPMVITGIGGAFSVVAANAWMNQPQGFTLDAAGKVVDTDPLKVLFNPATGYEVPHMILAAYMVVGFLVASIYAVGMLKGRRDRLHRLGLLIPLTIGLHRHPDPALRRRHRGARSRRPPAGQVRRHGVHPGDRHRPDRVRRRHLHRRRGQGGDPDPRPRLLPGRLQRRHRGDRARGHPGRRTAAGQHPAAPRLRRDGRDRHRRCSLLGAWLAFVWWRRRDIPQTPWFLRAVAVSGAGAILALWCGWIVTEVGRQPWIVQGYMRTSEAVTEADGIWFSLRLRAAALRGARHDRDPGPARDVAALARAGASRAPRATPYAPPTARRRRVSQADVAAAILWVGATFYALFGGADFGGGFWDLVAGGAERGRAAAGADPALADPGLGGQPRLADLHPRRPLDRLPAGLQRGDDDPLRADRAGRAGDRPARRRLRLPQVDRGRCAARRAAGATFALSSVLTPFFMGAVVGAIAAGNVPADGNGDAFSSWLQPLPLLTGAMFVASGAYLAAVFLVGDARRAGDDEMRALLRPPRARPPRSSPASPPPSAWSTLHAEARYVFDRLIDQGLPLVILSALCGLGVLASLALPARRAAWPLRPLAAGAVVAVIWGWGVAQFPYLLPTSLRIDQAAAPDPNPDLVFIVFVVAAVLVLPSLGLLYWLSPEGAAR